MKKIKLFLSLLMLFSICVGQVWAEMYTITFATNTSDGSTEINNKTDVSTVVSEGTDYVAGFTSSCSKAYYKGKNGVKLGSSSAAGTLEFNVASLYQANIKKITLKSAKYGSDSGTLTLYSGSTSLQSSITPGTDYTYTFEDATTVSSIKVVTSSKRAYVSEIILETEEGGGGCTGTKLGTPSVTATPADGQITLSWATVDNASSYAVLWNGAENWEGVNTNSYTKNSLTNGTAYTYQVKAIGDGATYCDSDPSVEASATPNVTYTITYNDKDGQHTISNVAGGTTLTSVLPENPTSCDAENYPYFAGWKAGAIEGSTTSVTVLNTEVANETTAAQEYYAVWADAEASAGGWEKVTSFNVDDEVIFVYEDGSWELTGVASNKGTATAYETNPAGTYVLTVVAGSAENSYAFKNGNNYLTYTGSSNTLTTSTAIDGTSSWTIAESAGGNFKLANVSTSGRKMQFNSSTGQERWACYTTNQKAFQIYKQAVPAEANYITTCCTKLSQINGTITWVADGNNLVASGWSATQGEHESGYLVKLYNSDKSAVLAQGNTTGTAKTYTFNNPGAGVYWVSVTPTGSGDYCAEGTETFSAASVELTGKVIVTFKKNGATGTDDQTQEVDFNQATALENVSARSYTAPDCKEFGGWAISEDNANAETPVVAYANGANITASEPTTLWAIWNTKTLSVAQGEGTAVGCDGDAFTHASSVACGGDVTITSSPKATHKGDPTITVLPQDAYEEIDGNIIKNVTKAITSISVSYEARASYNITWNVNGADLTGDALNGVSTSVLEGSAIANLPVVANDVLTCTNQFMGWSRKNFNTVPKTASDYDDLFTDGANAGEINDDVTFYAVFAKVTSSDPVAHENAISWSRSGTSDSYTTGYTFSATASAKTGYYQDGNNTTGLKLYHPSTALFTSTPSSVTLTASIGAGQNNTEFSNRVYAQLLDKEGNGIGNAIEVTTANPIASSAGDQFTPSFDLTGITSAYGVQLYHAKESGVNIRYYSFSLSYTTGGNSASNYVTECAAVAAPTFTVAAGTYNEAQSVELECETEGAEIRYTTNGDAPTSSSTLYESAIAVNQSMTIKAIAIKNAVESEVNSAAYELQVVDPTISGEASFMENTTVTLACSDANAQIRYTIDGNDPDANSALYENPFELNASATVKAIAVKSGWTSSEIVSKAFNKIQVLTVAEAKQVIDDANGGTISGQYVKGIISGDPEYLSNYKSLTYWISDDGTSNDLQVYSGKSFEGADFASASDLLAGDEVIVKGDLKLHNNTTYEFNYSNILIERKQRVLSIALSGEYATQFNEGAEFSRVGMVVTATYNYGDAANVTADATWSEPSMTTVGEQTVTVSYTFDGKTVTKDYTITIVHVCASEVAITKGAETNGTYTVEEGNVCGDEPGATVEVTDIEPAEGYRFKEITATAGTVDNVNKQVTGITAATTITVVFEPIPSYTVTWNVNGETTETSVQEGSKPVFPATPESCDATSTTFIGWATAAWTGKTANLNDKTVYTSAADMPDVDADVTYYAVFAKADGAGSAPTEYIMNDNDELNANWKDDADRNNGIQSYAGKSSFQMYGTTNTLGACELTSKIQFTSVTGVSINVAANNANTVSLYYSADGTNWETWANTVSVSKNTGAYTDYAFDMTNFPTGTYYVRLSNSKSSMYLYSATITSGSAPEYSDYMTTCCEKKAITLVNNGTVTDQGTFSADVASACEGATITITAVPNDAYTFTKIVVYETADDTNIMSDDDIVIDGNEAAFEMPAYPVTVNAVFTHKPCTQLGQPQVTVSGESTYPYAVQLAWTAIDNADAYEVYIYNNDDSDVESDIVTEGVTYSIKATLAAATTYKYTVQAVSNTPADYCASILASGSFTTGNLPAATLTLSEVGGAAYAIDADEHKLNDVVNLPSELKYAGCTGKVLKGWSSVAIETPGAEPTENYWTAGAEYTLSATTQTLYAVYATPGAGAETNVLSEDFASITAGNSTASSGSGSAWTPNDNFNSTASAVYKAGGAIRLGKSGSIVTKSLDLSAGSVKVSFKLKGWSASENTISVQVDEQPVQQATCTGYMSTGDFESKNLTFAAGTSTSVVKFTTSSSVRVFVDDINIDVVGVAYSDYTTSCYAALEEPTFSPEAGVFTEAQTVTISGPQGATIYYTVDGTEPTTESAVFSEAITINKCGENTIKAFAKNGNSESAVATATYTLNLPMPANSQEAPYTPAQAIDVYDGNGYCYDGTTEVYVKGVVTSATFNNSTNANAQAWNGSYNVFVKAIDDESETPVTFEFYRMWKDGESTAFESGDVETGDIIIAKGTLTKFVNNNTQAVTYEFNAGCYMVEQQKSEQPKVDISNTIDEPYTVAQADALIENVTSDLSKTVFVRGTVTAINGNKVTMRDAANGEEYIELYKSTLADGINPLVVGDLIIASGVMQKYSNTTYQMNEGCQVVWQKSQATIAIANIALEYEGVATITPTSVTPAAAAENIVYAIKEGSDDCITLAGANITAKSVTGVATIIASLETTDNYFGASVEFTVTVTEPAAPETRNIAQDLDGFDAISGNLTPADITFTSTQGDGTSVPALQTDGSILYYQPSQYKAAGGYMTLSAVHGCTIDQVKVVTADNNDTKIKYSADGGDLSDAEDVTAGAEYLTPASLNAETVNIYCAGADKYHRLYIAQVVVYYTGEAQAVDHYELAGTYATEFDKNAEFNHEGLIVYAAYDELGDDKVDITADCSFSTPNMSTPGEQTVEISYKDAVVKSYTITINATGKDDPALAYTPSEQTIAAADVASWSAPTFSNSFNVTPAYSSNNAAVATVDENGVIALAGGYGTATITASFAETEEYIASVATYTITVQEPANKIAGKWMVAGAEDIKPGIKVIVVGEKNSIKYTMGTQNSNNRAAVAAQSIVADTLYAAEGTKTFTLVDAGDGKYAFLANNGMYLYAASGSSNHLKEQATINGNATWSIAIANDGKATIQAQGTNSRNLMSMTPNGNNNPLFSCYKEEQSAIKLYVNRNQIDGSDDPANPAEVAISDNVVEEEIVANGNVIVTVNTDNFEEPKSYIAQNGATIIITGTNPVAKNVVVEDGSRIEASVPTTTPNVYFATTMGSTQTPGTASELGSVTNITLATGGEIIYDLTLGTSMAGIQADPNQWHAFTLPFAVDALNSIYDAVTGEKLENEVNYAIMDYHGDIRANGQYGWKKYRGILQPGVFYIMTVDGNTKTFRFKATQAGQMTQTTSMGYTAYNGSGDPSKDFGWNGIGNPSWVSGTVTVNVQVLDPYSYTYQPLTSSTNITVSTPFFYNAGGDGSTGSVVMQNAGTGANYAPARTPANEIKNVAVSFGNEVFCDKLYISASEDALNEYEQDKDLVRMIMSNTPKVAQIFGNAYGMKLSMVNTPLVNDKATVALDLYAPEAGEYTISIPAVEEYTVYLTREGKVIWNLSMSEYTGSFEKGNNAGYGIRIVKAPQVGTDIDNIYENASGVQKVVIDEHVYILRGEQMYDVNGKMVK